MFPVGVQTLEPSIKHDDDVEAFVVRSDYHLASLELLSEAVEGHVTPVFFVEIVEEWKI